MFPESSNGSDQLPPFENVQIRSIVAVPAPRMAGVRSDLQPSTPDSPGKDFSMEGRILSVDGTTVVVEDCGDDAGTQYACTVDADAARVVQAHLQTEPIQNGFEYLVIAIEHGTMKLVPLTQPLSPHLAAEVSGEMERTRRGLQQKMTRAPMLLPDDEDGTASPKRADTLSRNGEGETY